MAAPKPKSMSPVRRTTPTVEGVAAPERAPASVSEQKINQYRKRRYQALHSENEAANKRRAKGLSTARERVEMLLDAGTFVELDLFATHRAQGFGMEERKIAGDGVVAGFGEVDRRPVAVYSPAITDFIFIVAGQGYMFITGPEVIRVVTGEHVNFEELGGGDVHNVTSGVAHFLPKTEEECAAGVRRLLSYLPSSNGERPPYLPTTDDPERADPELQAIVPEAPNKPYDMRELVARVLDDREFFEVQPFFAPNIIVGFGRLGGHVAGIVGNQPKVLAGAI